MKLKIIYKASGCAITLFIFVLLLMAYGQRQSPKDSALVTLLGANIRECMVANERPDLSDQEYDKLCGQLGLELHTPVNGDQEEAIGILVIPSTPRLGCFIIGRGSRARFMLKVSSSEPMRRLENEAIERELSAVWSQEDPRRLSIVRKKR